MPDRLQFELVFLAVVGLQEPDLLARISIGVLGDQVLDFGFGFVVKRIVAARMSANSVLPPVPGTYARRQ